METEGLKEALELIQETAQQAQAAQLIDIADVRMAHYQIGSEVKDFEIPPMPRDHAVNSLQDMIAYVAENKSAVVWHGTDGVIAILDDLDRRDRVTFALAFSQRMETLRKLAKEKPTFDQTKFIRLLRIDLGLDNTAVVAKFRKLDWENGDKARGDVKHGDARLSREVIAKVEGIDQLPEEIRVPVPVYRQAGEREEYEVLCAVEIDARNQTFQLLPLPDEIERVIDLHQADIRSRLDADLTCPVYYGRP